MPRRMQSKYAKAETYYQRWKLNVDLVYTIEMIIVPIWMVSHHLRLASEILDFSHKQSGRIDTVSNS